MSCRTIAPKRLAAVFAVLAACGTDVAPAAPGVTGLSALETAPATAENVALSRNALLVDGVRTASAGIDVGYGRTLAGDLDRRDVGLGFASPTAARAVRLWFDRPLSPEVASAIAASLSVYDGDDDLRWAAVPITAATPSRLEPRVDISIAETQARFVKVALPPLAPGITADSSYRALFVTEIEVE